MSLSAGSAIQDSVLTLKTEERYAVSSYRFVILIIYILAFNQNILMWSVFNPLQSLMQQTYNESLTYINFGTILISNVSYIPANFIGNYIVDTYGLKIGVFVGSLLGLIGAWIRCLSMHGFIYIFIGQIFAGFAQPYFCATPQKFSNVWFAVHERAYSTTLMACSMLLGNCLGPIIPQWFIDLDGTDYGLIKSQLHKLMFYSALLSSLISLFTVIFMREKPKIPPSKAASAVKHSFTKSLKTLFRDRNCLTMIISTSIVYATFINYLSVFQQTILPFGFTNAQAGNMVSIATIVGLAGSGLGAVLIHKLRRYNLVIRSFSIISWFVLIWNLFAMESGGVVQFCIAVSIYQATLVPILPISLEYAVELAFPVGEATVGGIWGVLNQGVATVVSLVVDGMLGNNPSKHQARMAFIIMIVMQAVFILPLFLVRENLKRAKYEKEHRLLENESYKEITQDMSKEYVKAN